MKKNHCLGFQFLSSVLLSCMLLGVGGVEAQEERAAEHEALRTLRVSFVEAVNTRDFNVLRPLLTDSFTFITVNNKKLSGVAEMEKYWEELFVGESAMLESMTMAPESDTLTDFIAEDVGVVQGVSNDTFVFKTVGDRRMSSRWTAVVRKVDGQWKVDKVHMSGDILDNPVLDAQVMRGNIKGAIGLAIGLIGGFFLRALLARRGKNK